MKHAVKIARACSFGCESACSIDSIYSFERGENTNNEKVQKRSNMATCQKGGINLKILWGLLPGLGPVQALFKLEGPHASSKFPSYDGSGH